MDREVQINRIRKTIPETYRKICDKAWEGKSLRAAINAKCLDCCNFQRVEIKNCLVETCPLWAVRPYQERGIPAQKAPARGQFTEEQPQMVLNYG